MKKFAYVIIFFEIMYNLMVLCSFVYNQILRKNNYANSIKTETVIIIQFGIMGLIFVVLAIIYLLLDNYIFK